MYLPNIILPPDPFLPRPKTEKLFYEFISNKAGSFIVAGQKGGISNLEFIESEDSGFEQLLSSCSSAVFEKAALSVFESVAQVLEGRPAQEPLMLLPKGTAFQYKVWQQLLQIPEGSTLTYTELAEKVGLKASGSRAAGSAVAANPIALLIPCHRVVHKSGTIGEYRWGSERKTALLRAEKGQMPPIGLFA